MSVYFCPMCDIKLETVDGKKIGAVHGNKYRVCIRCAVVQPVKHRIHDPEARRRNSKPRGGPLANR